MSNTGGGSLGPRPSPSSLRPPEPTAPSMATNATPARPHRWLRRLSWALMGLALVLVGYVALLVGYQSYQQHRLTGAWSNDHPTASIADATFSPSGATGPRLRAHLADGEPVARLSIPSIGFNAIVS